MGDTTRRQRHSVWHPIAETGRQATSARPQKLQRDKWKTSLFGVITITKTRTKTNPSHAPPLCRKGSADLSHQPWQRLSQPGRSSRLPLLTSTLASQRGSFGKCLATQRSTSPASFSWMRALPKKHQRI